jgi:DNA primase
MSFSATFLDELRSRIPVSDVVGRKVKLKKQGREWRGLSPFNKERTPSFFVNDQKGFYHDFSSGKHGDIFTFLMETEGLTFPEAVEKIADVAGVQLPSVSKETEAFLERRKSLYDVLQLATEFFESVLASRVGAAARGYLNDRGVLPSTQREFRIGYAPPERFALKEFLGSKGISIQDMIEAGLLISGEEIPVPYDRFRDRVIIPIQDQRGRVIAFGGRTLKSDVQPKYLNSPDTPLFHKSQTVFNFHRARATAQKESSLIAVEGYLDAISLYQTGIQNVVALMGTAFTEDQIQSLWRLAPEPVICFDGDKAGVAAAERSLDRILPLIRTGVSFRYAFLPAGIDPDELIRDHGRDRFQAVVTDAIPLWDMLWEREFLKMGSISTPDQKAVFEKSLMQLLSLIGDKLLRDSYRHRARAQLVALFKSLDWKAAIKPKQRSFVGRELRLEPIEPLEGIEKVLLGTLIEYPDLLDIHLERLMNVPLSAALEQFKREIYRIFEEFNDRYVVTFYEQIHDDFQKVLSDVHGQVDKNRRLAIASSLFRRFPLLQLEPPPDFVAQCVELFFNLLEVRELEREIKEVTSDAKRIEDDKELERVTMLSRELVDMRGKVAHRDLELASFAHELRKQLQGQVLPTADYFRRQGVVVAVG